jgi:hypothetical protein
LTFLVLERKFQIERDKERERERERERDIQREREFQVMLIYYISEQVIKCNGLHLLCTTQYLKGKN